MENNTTAIRLRAYERLTLVIERMTPEHLTEGLDISGLSIAETVQVLIRKIQAEYDYNISQQIYVSDELWQQITFARDQMAAFVVMISRQMPEGSSTTDFVQAMAKAYRQNGDTPQQRAMETLKKEVRELF